MIRRWKARRQKPLRGDNGMDEEDITVTPCGRLGSRICVGEVDGKFIGEFRTDREANRAICAKMNRERFWPNVWDVSDHGNVSRRRIRCRR